MGGESSLRKIESSIPGMEEVKQFMRIPTEGNTLLEKLRELGVKSLEDLKEIQPQDLEKHETGWYHCTTEVPRYAAHVSVNRFACHKKVSPVH